MVRSEAVLALILALILALVLAGCVQPPPEPEPEDTGLPALEDFRGCPWVYPDNSTVDCESGAMPLFAGMGRPMGTVCVAERRDEGWQLHWDPTTGQHMIWYEVPENATGHTGLLVVRTEGQQFLFTWEALQEGLLRLPVPLGETASFRYETHAFDYAVNGSLEPAQGSQVWTLYEGQFWAVHQLETSNGTYSFQNMTVSVRNVQSDEGGDESRVFVEPRSFDVWGENFTLQVQHERSHVATSLGSVETVGVDRFCMTGLGL